MSGPQTTYQLAQDALEEHEQIHFFLDQLTQTLKSLKEGISDVEPMRRLAAQIEGMKERLSEHHELEERGGLFQTILDSLPGERVEVSRLVRDHEKMIEILEMARIHARYGELSEADALRIDLTRFMEIFRSHEQAEERLLEKAIRKERDYLD